MTGLNYKNIVVMKIKRKVFDKDIEFDLHFKNEKQIHFEFGLDWSDDVFSRPVFYFQCRLPYFIIEFWIWDNVDYWDN